MTQEEIRDKELYQEGYKQGLKEAFNKLECEEFDTCLRIEYEKSKAYEKALDELIDCLQADHSVHEEQLKHIRSVAEQLKKGTEVVEDCIMCGFYDSDYGCSCPSADRLYACPIESKKVKIKKN